MSNGEQFAAQLANGNAGRANSELCRAYGNPIIFGDAARPLVGRLHQAAGPLRGAVVLFSPWGYAENCSYLTYQLLARRLAERGIETLRFDYDGCGNSWGAAEDPDRLHHWIESGRAAIAWLRRRTACRVSVVGLGLGAALAVLASAEQAVHAAVLWDPAVTGRRYVRAQRAMTMMGVDAGADPDNPGSLMAIGHFLSAETLAEIEAIDLAALETFRVAHALVIGRPLASDARKLEGAMKGAGVETTFETHTGIEAMLDRAAEQSEIPVESVNRIVDWLDAEMVDDLPPLPMVATEASFAAPSPTHWIEQHLRLGPRALSAVLTLPQARQRAGVVVMLNNGIARAIGPARAWVEWSRQWAELGIPTLRLDLSGLGENPLQPGQREGSQYPINAVADLASVIGELERRGLTPIVLVGLCSGAFLGIDAAAAGLAVDGVVAINSQLFYLPDLPGSPDAAGRAAPVTHPWVQRFFENTRAGRRLAKVLPFPFWWLLDLLRLQPSPLRGAERAARRARLLLIYGEDNIGLERLRQRAAGALARWKQDQRLLVMPGLDHSMFAPTVRGRVERLVRSFLLERLPGLQAVDLAQTREPSRIVG